MPGPDGKLTKEEIAKALAWLGQRHKLACSVCGQRSWTLAEHLVQPVTLGTGLSVMLGGIGYPQVMRTCMSCGHSVMFNAVVMGIVPYVPPPETKS